LRSCTHFCQLVDSDSDLVVAIILSYARHDTAFARRRLDACPRNVFLFGVLGLSCVTYSNFRRHYWMGRDPPGVSDHRSRSGRGFSRVTGSNKPSDGGIHDGSDSRCPLGEALGSGSNLGRHHGTCRADASDRLYSADSSTNPHLDGWRVVIFGIPSAMLVYAITGLAGC
jgi:hypothetical protein